MKGVVFVILSFLLLVSCTELDELNQELCIPVSCGQVQNDKVNFALYNDSGIDFDAFYYSIGAYKDSLEFFPLKQYSCWINFDSITTDYVIAKGVAEGAVYQSDTIRPVLSSNSFSSGIYILEIFTSDTKGALDLQFIEDSAGECKDI